MQNQVSKQWPSELPVVATPLAVQGLSDETARILDIGQSPEEFGSKTTALLVDPELAKRKGDDGRRHVLTNYSWGQPLAQLIDLLEATGSVSYPNQLASRTFTDLDCHAERY